MSALSSDDKLVRSANQIASFFRSYPDKEAVAGIHKHVVAFWTPKMLKAMRAYIPQAGERVDPLVVQAFTETPEAESPVRAATNDPALAGAGASDAG